MSNPDSFIDEVTEEVRRDRLFRVFRRYGWIGLVLVAGIVGGAAWNEWQKSQQRAAAEGLGDALLAAIDLPDAAARNAALAAVPASGDAQALAALIAAAEGAAGGDAAAAITRLQAVAEDPALSPLWRDLVSLRALSIPGEHVTPQARQAGLQALAQPGRPFRVLAQEQLAVLKLGAGDRDGALADFRALAADPQAPSALRARAGQMIVVLGGDPQPAQD